MEREDLFTDGRGIRIRLAESRRGHRARDGRLLLTVRAVRPMVEVRGNAAAGRAVTAYARSFSLPGMDSRTVARLAEADYAARGRENWRGYMLDTQFVPVRADEAVISFLVTEFLDMGGAHPDTRAAGLNFSSHSGKRLRLDDVVLDKRAAVRQIHAFLLKEAKRKEAAGEAAFFEGYEKSIGELLTEDTWYLGRDGMHVIGNEYIVSPHAAGILDFVIPYGQADFLKEEYR